MSSNLTQLSLDVLAQVDIVEIISHYMKLKKQGNLYGGLCPFHDDHKMGNFYVNKEKQYFKCYACNKSGNAINFVQYRENCSYYEAIVKVCEIANIKDPRLNQYQKKTDIDPLLKKTYEILDLIDNFYLVSLNLNSDGKEALTYLHNRGLDDEIINKFKIGYAQKDGENLIKYLYKKGYGANDIERCGIANANITPLKDSNAGRIIFTISDRNNQVVGFSARIFGDMISDSKYINTRETIAFKKATILYNFSNAFEESRKVNYCYLLEGFMDVIACYRVGIKSAIGLMGTALTKEQIQLLRYMKCEIRLCLDKDAPGQDNMDKITTLLDEAQIPYRLVSNYQKNNGKDADEILKNDGAEGLKAYLNNLISEGERKLNYYSNTLNLESLEGRKNLLRKFVPFLAKVNSLLDYEDYINKAAYLTRFSKETIESLVKKEKNKTLNNEEEDVPRFNNNPHFEENKTLTRLQLAEKQIMNYVLSSKEAYDLYEERLGYLTNKVYRDIISLLEEFIGSEEYNKNYDVSALIPFISSMEDSGAKINKEQIIDEITSLTLSKDNYFPPYSKEGFLQIIDTINIEREKERTRQAYKEGSRGKSPQEQAKQAQALLNKRKYTSK